MSGHLEGDIITPTEVCNADVIRVERVWQHRHDLELTIPKHRHNRARFMALGAGGLLLGAICVFAYGNLIPANGLDAKEALASTPVAREIVTPSTKLRDVADTATATVGISETQAASLPYVAIPTKRPFYEPARSGKPDRSTSTTSASDVVRFGKCKPGCDTRDPLVVGTTPAAVHTEPAAILTETAEFENPNPAMEVGASVLYGAGYVLTQTAALPFTTLRLGRDAVVKVSGLD
ncbi:hypothetical protein FY140_06870 [Agrobacterium tumefaciens]|uniref:hypothetical protein n=1 Tax=Agrobacterium tumefaciens TaxID=358 RepID=UPI0021D1946D|nr:hypothetical protein [Agrobacterium tumefaciens]UXT20450.1 hypothetical protein FY140_06870 [Agrobacterium tumefaciens]